MSPPPGPRLPAFWQLEGFTEQFDAWAAEQSASPGLRRHVLLWIFSRYEDPYAGVRRQPGAAELWWGHVPGTLHGDSIVVCAYWIAELERAVRCDRFVTLSLAG
jgi:hypothetical protein